MSADPFARDAFHSLGIAAARAKLDAPQPLTTAQVHDRLRKFGRNELPEAERIGLLGTMLRQFRSPLIYLLIVAGAVSLAIGELSDAGFILAVLLVNAAVGTVQEIKAERGTAALRRMLRQSAIVERDGARVTIDAAELVPGDHVVLESGARVPADLRLVQTDNLVVDESLLTGESVPVSKDARIVLPEDTALGDRRNTAYSASLVLAGRAVGLVTATGTCSELGRIAESLVTTEKARPPLVIKLDRFTRMLGITVIVAVAAIGAMLLWSGMAWNDVLFVSVALMVSAIPEGLPVAITVALAIATARMARRHVIVRSLPVVEGLGSCTLIASDKTGTLTCNRLTLRRLWLNGHGFMDVGGIERDSAVLAAATRLATSGVLASEAEASVGPDGPSYTGDTVDIAVLVFAAAIGIDFRKVRQAHTALGAIPFEAERRHSAIFTAADGKVMAHVKGAAETIVPMCAGIDAEAVLRAAEEVASDGYRVLAIASGSVVRADAAALHGLTFLGLIGLIDPVRPEAPDAVRRCREAGIQVCMVTGDHPATALAIARELGVAERPTEVVTGRDLKAVEGDAAASRALFARTRVFARVEPRQKLSIVRTLQQAGHVVAVTGDGGNDAPALRQSGIGVAMGLAGTDIARDAADLVITDDNFSSIVAGVEEGRVVLDNVRKILIMLLSTGAAEILVFLLAFLAGLPIPFLAVQLLWLNLVTNGIQDVALAFEPGEKDILRRRPRSPREPLLDRRMLEQLVLYGGAMGAIAFALFSWCLAQGYSDAEARNATLLTMVVLENLLCLTCRSERRSLFAVPLSANWMIVAGVAATLLLHLGAMYAPWLSDILRIGPIDTGLLFPVALGAVIFLAITELYKAVHRSTESRLGTPAGAAGLNR
jgi:P-type Ca2+ transporter type 2C